MFVPEYITDLSQIDAITHADREKLQEVTERFKFKTNEY